MPVEGAGDLVDVEPDHLAARPDEVAARLSHAALRRLHHRGLQGPAEDIVVAQLELAEVGDDDDLVLLLDDDVLELAEIEFVDMQAPLRRAHHRFGEALRRPVRPVGLRKEVAAEAFLGNLHLERVRDVLGELLGVEERRLLPEAIHRSPEDLLQ